MNLVRPDRKDFLYLLWKSFGLCGSFPTLYTALRTLFFRLPVCFLWRSACLNDVGISVGRFWLRLVIAMGFSRAPRVIIRRWTWHWWLTWTETFFWKSNPDRINGSSLGNEFLSVDFLMIQTVPIFMTWSNWWISPPKHVMCWPVPSTHTRVGSLWLDQWTTVRMETLGNARKRDSRVSGGVV
jgi:hypothetical protein